MEQYGGYTTIRYRACFGAILFLFFRKETPPLTHSPPTPQKNAIQISEICLHFEKWKKNDNSPLRSLILFWKAATFTSERKPTVESLAWESQNDSGVKAMSYFLKWLSRLFFFFFFFFKVVLLFKVLGNVKQYRNFWYLKSEAVFAWAEPYVLHWSAADHHFGHLTARHEHRTANTHRPKVRSETLERVTTMQDPMKEILLIGRY